MQAKAKNITQILNSSKMSEQQKRYALAKAKKEEAEETYKKFTEDLRKRESDLAENFQDNKEELKEINDKLVDIEKKMGLIDAKAELRKAERELVRWAFEVIEETEFFKESKESKTKLEVLKGNWWKFPRIKKKVIDTAFRLNPES